MLFNGVHRFLPASGDSRRGAGGGVDGDRVDWRCSTCPFFYTGLMGAKALKIKKNNFYSYTAPGRVTEKSVTF